MRTSRQVYFQLRYDPRFDPRKYTIGYDARREAPAEKALIDFMPDGEIPWHRVLYLRDERQYVWNRATRLDALVPPAQSTPAPRVPFGAVRAAEALPGPPLPAGVPISLLTWNVLSDRFDHLGLRSQERVPLLIEALRRFDADVLLLQEVFPSLWAALKADPVLSRRYALPDHSPGLPGVAILSRFAIERRWLVDFSPHKRLVVADIGPLRVVGCHFTSDHSRTAQETRAKEWAAALAVAAEPEGPAVIAGDFNDQAPVLSEFAASPTAATYEPSRNPLAAIGSVSGSDRTLDHVLARGLAVETERVICTGDLPASDHWPLLATLTPPHSTELDTHTALVLLLPEALWPAVQPCRLAHDGHAPRWPPHITLRHPFVSPARLAEVADQLASATRALSPFTLRFETLGHFEHSGSMTHWAAPFSDPPDGLTRLNATIDAVCREGRRHFTPHLTLGQSAEPHAPALVHHALQALSRHHWPVHSLTIIRRHGSAPFEVLSELPLGPARRGVTLSPVEPRFSRCERVLAAIRQVWPQLDVEVIGSARLGLDDGGCDVDVVARFPQTTSLDTLVEQAPWPARVTQGHVPRLEFSIDGIDVDLLAFDAQNPRSLEPGLDADAVLSRLTTHQLPSFRAALTELRRWLEARGLVGQWAGYPSGLAWAALVAQLVRDGAQSFAELIHGLAMWPADAILSSQGLVPALDARWLTVHTDSGHNASRGLVAATRRVLRYEFSRILSLPEVQWFQLPAPEWEVTRVRFGSKSGAVDQLIHWEREGLWARPVVHRDGRAEVWLAEWNHAALPRAARPTS